MTRENKAEYFSCLPNDDPKKRLVLGEYGKNNLLAVGLNPSTANSQKLDPTSKNIQRIAKSQKCDGWLLVNLYPYRTPNPSNLPQTSCKKMKHENLQAIEDLLWDRNISKVLYCWGNGIETRNYLPGEAQRIVTLITEHHIPQFCLGTTQKGHPYHPSPQVINRLFGGVENVILTTFLMH